MTDEETCGNCGEDLHYCLCVAAPTRPSFWGPGRRCNECGNPTWECWCIGDNMSEE